VIALAVALFCIKKGIISVFLAPVSGESNDAHIFSHGEKFGDARILNEDRKVNAQKLENQFYAPSDLWNVRAPGNAVKVVRVFLARFHSETHKSVVVDKRTNHFKI